MSAKIRECMGPYTVNMKFNVLYFNLNVFTIYDFLIGHDHFCVTQR